MPLYKDFSDVYDIIFQENKTTTTFLNKHLKKTKILDIACGTGTYAINLASNGFDVVGIDLDQSMVEQAKEKRHDAYNPLFYVQNMLDLSSEDTYHSIYSIGNSIVHLKNETMIKTMLNKIYNALKDNGVFVMQIINYTRILEHNIDHLSTIQKDGVTFERLYDYHPPYIHFNTALTMNDTTTYNTVRLYPIRPKTIIAILKNSGFANIHTFGSFNEAPFDEQESVPFIVTATKTSV